MAIQTFIFDMGNVLIDYNPDAYTKAFFPNPDDAALATHVLFEGELWQALDAGRLTEEEALPKMLVQLPERLRKPARALFYGWQSYVRPIPETNALAVRLHKAGYGLYILSNTGVRLHVYSHRIPAFQVMDGAVYSADVQLVKPDPAIFQTLFARYHLRPQACYFIDDNADNIAAARGLGVTSFLFTGDSAALEADIRAHGVHF